MDTGPGGLQERDPETLHTLASSYETLSTSGPLYLRMHHPVPRTRNPTSPDSGGSLGGGERVGGGMCDHG